VLRGHYFANINKNDGSILKFIIFRFL